MEAATMPVDLPEDIDMQDAAVPEQEPAVPPTQKKQATAKPPTLAKRRRR